jgi:hypothetical protein
VNFYNEAQEQVLVTMTVKAWKRRWAKLPRFMRPKAHGEAVFHGDHRVPSWEAVEVPLRVYRQLDAYLHQSVGLGNFEVVIHDVGIAQQQPLEFALEEAARIGAHA